MKFVFATIITAQILKSNCDRSNKENNLKNTQLHNLKKYIY